MAAARLIHLSCVSGRPRDQGVTATRLLVLDSEWPACDAAFGAWLAPDNFDNDGNLLTGLAALRDRLAVTSLAFQDRIDRRGPAASHRFNRGCRQKRRFATRLSNQRIPTAGRVAPGRQAPK